ncbi:uncharacterized protein LOC122960461 [Acropora millepora]|uniref:uncharacterized protein LOC122960461 n=1 Tax=Acropora millepora TaxID=45264 RepID=UPI001CF49F6E|nr:uncharacterized protein LOC122960461 [Acropora millepora]
MSDVQSYILEQRPENTVKKTNSDLNTWKRYLKGLKEEREIEFIPSEELNLLMCRFFMDAKKKDGGPYEPSTLTSFQRSLQRYLKDKGSKLNILKDTDFSKSREVLLAKKKQLVEESAKGNRPRAAREITEEEEDLLFTSGEFGDHNAEALQRTVWWLLSMQFGFRAWDESRKLKWGDVSLITDATTKNEVLLWTGERGSKTRHGESARAFNPTAQATSNKRCPVKYYKSFKSHRPEEMLTPDSPFFLAINHRRKPQSQIWSSKAPLGKNEIGKFMAEAAKRTGLPGNVTNHSVRKTCVSRLMDAEVPVNYGAQLSGHKNLKSLDSYKVASIDHQRHMSLVLSRSTNEASHGPSSTPPTSSMVGTTQDTMFSRLMPFKDAILSNIGVRGVRVAVVNCEVLPATQPVKWEGVSNVNNLLYEDTILTVWRAYDIGKGKTYLLSQLQGMGKFFR